ncbi:type I-E CRISPR-associated protein Cas6/Cse3/CasE [Jeongeupia sp. HS-3]|uniref:type I-E CRISPR-associated protein Cas6/Cse3/CasE n=1 Tax=Jeongeupia sp. HS-3 TaxID=1009682 RepID=UPI0018A3F985|nr:type I-E CRISPR-associated protein Cas6/Cse3/CasE [Jeongeupia sp. HS-3]BCL75807.1 type I-E CRISPR-associated protein Cas6/Cse3/CasE [Jeongeupia sp. HS-3]
MSYFSRVRVNPRGLDRQQLSAAQAGDAYRDHALVWQLFPGDASPRDFAFRAERSDDGQIVYYVVSQREPQALPGCLAVDAKPFNPRLVEGEWLRFDLRANPTVAIHKEGTKRSQRHDVLMHAKQGAQNAALAQAAMDAAAAKWLVSRAASWGLEIEAASVLASSYTQHRLGSKGRNIRFSSVDYQGMARVIDAGKLQQAMLHGVGHAKAFGCGLLLVKRIA